MKKYYLLAVITLFVTLTTHVWAQQYDFSAVAPSGQTLYYKINGSNVSVVPQNSSNPYYSWYPTGNLTIPDTVTYNGAIYSVTSIGNSAFYTCSGLTSVTIPNSVTSIDTCAFTYCSGLTSIAIPNSVTSVDLFAFSHCSGLTSVTIPSSVTSIGDGAFSCCERISSISVTSGNTIYDSRNNCNAIIENATNTLVAGCLNTLIPNSVTSIGDHAFCGCSGLTSVNIPSSITSIDTCAFLYCSGLTSISIPSSVTSIGYGAFGECSGLTSIIIPNSVTSIGGSAFYGCSGLTSVTIPNSVISIGRDAFTDCSGLTSIIVSTGNTVYDSRSNCNAIIESATNTLTAGCMNTIIPNSVTSIGITAFYGCSGLTSVTIPNSVTSIGDFAFYGCSGLRSVVFKSGTPPRLGSYHSIPSGTTITIPCGSRSAYTSLWGNNYTYQERFPHALNVATSDTIQGTVTIQQQPSCANDTAIIAANPAAGYHFTRWSNGSTDNPYNITIVGDSTIIAFFALTTYHLTANVNDATLGSVTMPEGDSAHYQDTLMVVASPAAHYHVAHWQGENIMGVSSNKDTAWVRIYGDCSVTCHFAIDTYSVTVVSSDIVRGSVTGSGTFIYGTPCTVEATAYTGYTFHSWSNGVTANPYIFAVLDDVILTAIFLAPGEETYTVTVSVNDPTMGTATVNGNTSATVMNGETVTLLATPNAGYRFVKWSDENTDASRTVAVTRDMSFTATFVSTQGIEDAASANLNIYAKNGRICVTLDGQTTDEFSVYDVMGRRAAHVIASDKSPVLPAGVYIVKVGTLPARKVVVIR